MNGLIYLIRSFFKSKSHEANEPTTEELLEQLEELKKNRDFFLTTIKTLFFFLKEFSFHIDELDAESFKARVERLYKNLASNDPLRDKEQALEENKTAILEYIRDEYNYFKEKEAEFKKIIELLLDGMNQMVGENREFNSMVYESNLRVEAISQLDDIRKIKDSLSVEIAQIKKTVQKKQSKDESRIEGLSKEVFDLRTNLEKAQKASMVDALTGAYNRLALDAQLNRLAERFGVSGVSFSLLLCDLDDFKIINDSYGHQIGDRVLKAFVLECQQFFRQDDFIGRYGGEEFAILMPNASMRHAMKRAEMFCKIIAANRYLVNPDNQDDKISFTISIGVAGFRSKDTVDSIIGRADKALYQAKKEGKNRVRKE